MERYSFREYPDQSLMGMSIMSRMPVPVTLEKEGQVWPTSIIFDVLQRIDDDVILYTGHTVDGTPISGQFKATLASSPSDLSWATIA